MSAARSITQVGTQLAGADTADAIRIHTAGAGLVVGTGETGRPVAVTFVRREPTLVAILGRLVLAQVVGFRALALGARLTVTSVRPSAWSPLARAAADIPGAVEIAWPDHQPELNGSSLQPQLLVVDTGSTAAASALPAPRPWSTLVAVREQIADRDIGLLGRADLILTQNLPAGEAERLCRALGIGRYAKAIATMPPGALAAISHGQVCWARLAPTVIEQQLLGAPR